MKTFSVKALPDGEERRSSCPCCGRPIFAGCGHLEIEGKSRFNYWYRWSEGHEDRFTVAIGFGPLTDGDRGRVVALAGVATQEGIQYSVMEPDASPWGADFGEFGMVLSRREALREAASMQLFAIVDAVAANEKRLSQRLLRAMVNDA